MNRNAAALLLLAACIAAAPAAKPSPKPGAGAPAAGAQVGQWDVKTTQMNANLATGQFSAPDHVTMTRSDGSVIVADRATGNYKKKLVSLYGNVSVHDVSGSFGLSSASSQAHGPSTLTTDELIVNDLTRLYDAKGNVHYTQNDTNADSETAHLNDKTHELRLAGKVHVVQADRTMYADSAVYNTLTGDGVADKNVRIEFPGITPQIATPRPIIIKKPKIP